MTASSPAPTTPLLPASGPAPGAERLRPWYRSRFFWAGIPGLLFLLWAWWDSGAHTSQFAAYGRTGLMIESEILKGGLQGQWKPGDLSLSPGDWHFSGARWRMEEGDAGAMRLRPRQFDVARAFGVREDWNGLGPAPAAHGWVPSPGRPFKLTRLDWQVSWWMLLLCYLLAGTLFLACWQYWKGRRRESRGGPRSRISLHPWLPFTVLLGLTGCLLDSLQTRTRGWVGNGKYHAGWSHHRGLFTVSLFHEPLAPDGADLDGGFFREPMGDGGLTPRSWPRWIGPDSWHENAWELRLPTTFTIGGYLALWAGVASVRWQRQRACLRKHRPLPSSQRSHSGQGEPMTPQDG